MEAYANPANELANHCWSDPDPLAFFSLHPVER